MSWLLRRIVDLRAGEGRLLFSMSLILALVTGAHTVLETARDTLFLSKLPPDRLAFVYVLLAALSLVVGALSSAISRRFGRRAGFVITLGLSAYAITVLYLRPPTPLSVFVLYITSGVIGTILMLQFWLFAGQLFSVAQGKRLFGAMAAGGVLGATIGATVAAVMLRFVAAQTLLVVGAVTFLAAALCVTIVPTEEEVDATDPTPVSPFAWLKDVSLLRDNRYVALIGTLVAVSTAAVLITDYLFKSTAAVAYPKDLGTFLGGYYAVQNAMSLFVQVVLTGAIVRKLGVTSALLLFPVLLASGALGVFITGGFAFALGAKATDGSLRHSLHRVTSELLLLPLPSGIRDKSKRLFDTMLGRGAQAVAATAIVVLAAQGLAVPHVLGAVVLLLAVVWLGVALMLRAPYLDVFRTALARGELPEGEQELDLSAVETILESLASPEEAQVVAAIDLLAHTRKNRLLPALILYHESPVVLEHALAVFATDTRGGGRGASPRRDFGPLAERLLGHRDPTVRGAAVRALAASGNRGAAELALDDADPGVRAHAAFFLVDPHADPAADARVAAMLAESGADGPALRKALLEMVSTHGEPRWAPVVREILKREAVRRIPPGLAATAVRRTLASDLAPYLVERLAERGDRLLVRDALVALGEPGFRALADVLESEDASIRSKRQVARAIAAFGSQEAVDLLTNRVEHEKRSAVRYRVLRALGRLSTDAKEGNIDKLKFDREKFEAFTGKELTEYLESFELYVALDESRSSDVEHILVDLLKDHLEQTLERAFRFLQLAHKNEDIQSAYLAVVRGDKRARATALEFLDVLTLRERTVRALLRLVVDELPAPERVRRARELFEREGPPASREKALARLATDEDELLASLASTAMTSTATSEERDARA